MSLAFLLLRGWVMQLVFNWWPSTTKTPRPEIHLENGRTLTVEFRRSARARRYVLYLRRNGLAQVTIPRHGSEPEAWKFVQRQRDWLQQKLTQLETRPRLPVEWGPGTEIFFRGELVRLALATAQDAITLADESVPLRRAAGNWRPLVEAYLQQLARLELTAHTQSLAEQHDCLIERVTVRNQRTRWGSCSAQKNISLNWRLIQTPPSVRDYIILHELMHTREMNHSTRFWASVARVCPHWKEAEQWLQENGPRLIG